MPADASRHALSGERCNRAGVAALVALGLTGMGCDRDEPRPSATEQPGPDATASSASDGGTTSRAPSAEATAPPVPSVMPEPRCSPEMVKVTPGKGRPYCVDRYEASLVDDASSRPLSPYYAPSRKRAIAAYTTWSTQRLEVGPPAAREMGLPELPGWQRTTDVVPRARSVRGVWPNGHVTGLSAAAACASAGKRLCTPTEWRVACGGEAGQRFPYGTSYVAGQCNVFREAHPAGVLHENPSIGHDDPRLNRVSLRGKPLLRKTGDTPTCASRWGDDVIYDMVGNLDEWVDHPRGSFAGGFYARSTKEGCDWHTTAHGNSYADYSTGVRCCAEMP
ncbi:MAG: SUMF1/EgtB/PvdO family nonheme iron enzyme [Deltaproteobacteria bacterium]|nr:SUMF1/EgtB/PvdO family nonheme iron enzyme [Deltaproteobacteria bacterium]